MRSTHGPEQLQFTAEHQRLQRNFEAEIEKLRLQRTRYRTERDHAQSEVKLLQGQLDDAQELITDLKASLERALEAATSLTAGQVLPEPPHCDPMKANGAHYIVGDDEAENVGSSTSVGSVKIRHLPTVSLVKSSHSPLSRDPKRFSKSVPFVSIPPRTYPNKRDRESGGWIQTSNDHLSEEIRSEKRRKVDFTVASSESTPSPPRNSRGRPLIPFKELPSSTTLISKNASPQMASQATQDGPIASSSKVKLPGSPNKSSPLPSLISGYLGACNSFDIIPSPSPLCVPRQFLNHTYGGSDQQLLQYIPASRNPSARKQRRIIFPSSDVNPAMPSTPGEPGLLFISRDEILKNSPWTLFHTDLATKKAVWTYLGEYEGELRGKMSLELFRSQPLRVKQALGGLIMKKFDVYVEMRARIALRKAGLSLSVKNVGEEISQIKRNTGRPRPVSMTDVMAALESGEEAIDIVRIQCASYDREFARDMETKFQIWSSPDAIAQRKADRLTNAKYEDKRGKRVSGIGARRRSPRKLRRILDEDDTSEGDDDSDAGQPPRKRNLPRGVSMKTKVPSLNLDDGDSEQEQEGEDSASWKSDLTDLSDDE